MEGVFVDIGELRMLLDDKFNDKLNPIIKAIEKLEKAQEDMVEIMRDLAITTAEVKNLENNFRIAIENNTKTHDTLFERLRQVEDSSQNKLWDVLKLIIAVAFGGIIAVLVGKR